MTQKVCTRFAPSPTGELHIGGLRTALYAYAHAKNQGGDFLIRIEDTDQTRYVEGAEERLLRDLERFHMVSDRTIEHQSERLAVYKEHVERLVDAGHAYYCFCTPERLTALREEQQQNKRPPMYDRHCHEACTVEEARAKVAAGESHVVRLLVPRGRDMVIDDAVRGKIAINTNTVDDQVLLKSDGFPTYHLAVVVDDHLMGVTHVLRGEEWISSTPKHVLLYEAFGWDAPTFAHLPLLLNTEKKRFSKRDGAASVRDFLAQGYLPDAVLNFVALLGWHPGGGSTEEVFSLKDFVERFSLGKVHKSGAVVDMKKLDWLNGQYIKQLTLDKLYAVAVPFLEKQNFYEHAPADCKTESYVKRVLAVEQERLQVLAHVGTENHFFFVEDIEFESDMLAWKDASAEETRAALTKAQELLAEVTPDDWTRDGLEKMLMDTAGDNRGAFLWPLRVALTGAQRSPSPFDCAWVLSKERTLARIEKALEVV